MKSKGVIAAIVVKAAVNMIKNAFLSLALRLVIRFSFLLLSSVIIIWSSTPVPTAAIIPAIAARSIVQCIREATPSMIRTSLKEVRSIGITILKSLYRTNMTKLTTTIAKIIAKIAVFMKDSPSVGLIISILTISSFVGSAPDSSIA